MKTNPDDNTKNNPAGDHPAHGPVRMLDANANRAAEGLRTMEDLARFALGDGEFSGYLKKLRHELRATLGALPLGPTARLEARDTPGDPGTGLSTTAEQTRAGLDAVAASAAGRVTESLRVLEELAKVLRGEAPGVSGRVESLRYRVYDAEKRLRLALRARAPQWRLCVLLTTNLCDGRDPVAIAAAAIEGGADCLQIREKTMDSGPLLDLTRRVVQIARPPGVAVIVNDRADIARLAGADGVHVGQHDLSVAETRRLAGAGAIVGVSTANPEQARRAVADGASYCGCGPMFTSTTKAKPSLSGPEYLAAYLSDGETRDTPHLAISGITNANLPRLTRVGCRGVAVSSAVCSAADPAGACRKLLRGLSRAPLQGTGTKTEPAQA